MVHSPLSAKHESTQGFGVMQSYSPIPTFRINAVYPSSGGCTSQWSHQYQPGKWHINPQKGDIMLLRNANIYVQGYMVLKFRWLQSRNSLS